MKTFLIRRWFLLVLALMLAIGIGLAEPLRPLTAMPGLRQSVVVVVMFLMAFPLRAGAIWETIQRPRASLLAVVITYGFVPLLAWALCLTLAALWSGFSDDMAFGILIAATAPSTLASAAVWTRRAGGNDAVAILVTLVTNLLCFLVTPSWLSLMIGRVPDFDPLRMAADLALLVVLPLVVAQVLRLVPVWAAWATERKTPIGVLAQGGVLVMVFLGAIQTGHRLTGDTAPAFWANLVAMVMIVMVVHISALFAGLRCSRWFGLGYKDAVAVGFAGSQKTTMVGLEVSVQLGVTVLPMVAYHVGQLLFDTVVADRLQKPS